MIKVGKFWFLSKEGPEYLMIFLSKYDMLLAVLFKITINK